MRTPRTRMMVACGLLLGCLGGVPASIAEDLPPVLKKDIRASSDCIKQIVIAFHNHCSNNGEHLPSDILDKDGKPLLSWRVAILPYLDEKKLYDEFKLDQPWDSDHNKKLIEKMPKIYSPIRVKAKTGETFYQTFTGKRTLFEDHKPRYMISNIPDGTSNTGLIFEAGEPVVWSKPIDMLFEEKKAIPKLGGMFNGECLVGMADGSVRHLKKDPNEEHLKYLIMPDDGMIIIDSEIDY